MHTFLKSGLVSSILLFLLLFSFLLLVFFRLALFPYQLVDHVDEGELTGVWELDLKHSKFRKIPPFISEEDKKRFQLTLKEDGSFQMVGIPPQLMKRVYKVEDKERTNLTDSERGPLGRIWCLCSHPHDEKTTVEGKWQVFEYGTPTFLCLDLTSPGYNFDYLLVTYDGLFWPFGFDLDSYHGIAFSQKEQ